MTAGGGGIAPSAGSGARKTGPEAASPTQALEVFISYSRSDMAAADALVDSLEAAGFAVTIDRRDLNYGEQWQDELAQFIRAADTVVWLVSTTSVASHWCQWELGEVLRLGKRLLPVALEAVEPASLPGALGRIHMLPAEGRYRAEVHLPLLTAALHADHAWLKQGTALAMRAHQWRGHTADEAHAPAEPDTSALLTGRQLAEAERWRLRQPRAAPAPGTEVLELILASREAATRRQRLRRGLASGVAALGLTLAAFAWWQRSLAVEREQLALGNESRMLVGLAQRSLAEGDAVEAMLLALQALPDPDEARPRPYLPEAARMLATAALEQREEQQWFESGGLTMSVQPAADATRLLTISDDNRLRRYDLRRAEEPVAKPGTPGLVTSAVWSADGKRLLAISSGLAEPPRAYLWDLQGEREIAVLSGHSGSIEAAAFSLEGRWLATGSDDGVVQVHDAHTGELRARHEVPMQRQVSALAIDEHGNLAVGDSEGRIHAGPADGKTPLRPVEAHPARIGALHFVDGGRRLLSLGWDQRAQLWHAGTMLRDAGSPEAHLDIVLDAALHGPSGALLTGSQDDTAALWNLNRLTERPQLLRGHNGDVFAVDFQSDGTAALTASRDGTVRLWDVASQRPLAVLRGHAMLGGARFVDHGGMVVTWGGGTLRRWRTDPALRLTRHAQRANGVRHSPDGALVLSHGGDGALHLSPVGDGPRWKVAAHRGPVVAADFTPSGERIWSVGQDATARAWRTADGQPEGTPLQGLGRQLTQAALSPDMRRLLTADEATTTATLWSLEPPGRIADLEPPPGAPLFSAASRLAFSADGRRAATVAARDVPASGTDGVGSLVDDDIATLWDAESGRRLWVTPAAGAPIKHVALDADGSRLALALVDGRLRVFDTSKGELLAETRLEPSFERQWATLHFDSPGTRLLASHGQAAYLWQFGSQRPPLALRAERQTVGRAVLLPDGATVASGDHATVRLWNADTGAWLATLPGPVLGLRDFNVSRHGDRLAMAGSDGEVRQWRVFPNTRALIAHARASVPRCLDPPALARLSIKSASPAWCAAKEPADPGDQSNRGSSKP